MDDVKVLIVYDSITGNVEAMANAVKEGIVEGGATAVIKKADEVDTESISSFDAYAFGSPTHCGTMSAKMNDFFNNKLHSRRWKRDHPTVIAVRDPQLWDDNLRGPRLRVKRGNPALRSGLDTKTIRGRLECLQVAWKKTGGTHNGHKKGIKPGLNP